MVSVMDELLADGEGSRRNGEVRGRGKQVQFLSGHASAAETAGGAPSLN